MMLLEDALRLERSAAVSLNARHLRILQKLLKTGRVSLNVMIISQLTKNQAWGAALK
jgi:hypothetical protein